MRRRMMKWGWGLGIAALALAGASVEAKDHPGMAVFGPEAVAEGVVLVRDAKPLPIMVDATADAGILRAVANLSEDFRRVTGNPAPVIHDIPSSPAIIVGQPGSKIIDGLIADGAIDRTSLEGKYEKYVIKTVSSPFPGVDEAVVVAGSDRRGTIYGIYELSEQIGVSPWYDWADVPVAHQNDIAIRRGEYSAGEPAVKVRGIFLNDEFPCLGDWVKNTYSVDFGSHEFYERVFELILRLRGNFIWPAMWGWAFYADDPLNSRTADEMGLMVGTSHHEPMARNHQEWARKREEYGPWNYKTNKETLDSFFRYGLERIKGTEDIVTIGMRGDGDEAMSEEADVALLEEIIANQRRIIAEMTGRDPSETPQVWALYKEVLDYYDKEMEVPDDVTLLLCDDNWGNVRRVPEASRRDRAGGWGLYYHVDYVGAPRNSKLLNCTPTQNMWEQLTMAYDFGIDRLWILNVGDLKPMEYPITLFMDMAWNPTQYRADIRRHTGAFFRQQFGEKGGDEAARIYNLLAQYNGRVTPEMLDKDTYRLAEGEWKAVCDSYRKLETEAWRQYNDLAPEYRDAYMQFILFPLQVMTNLHEMYYAQAMNQSLHAKGLAEANEWARETERCFLRDRKLMDYYNLEMSGGKWNGMMHQKHIGYTSWNDDFPADTLPEVFYVTDAPEGGYLWHPENGKVTIETDRYYSVKAPAVGTAEWTFTPQLGPSAGGMALMPYTEPVEGGEVSYAFTLPEATDSVTVTITVKSNLAFLDREGHKYSVSVDGGEAQVVNYNANLNEAPENIYTVFYPTVARRVVESTLRLPLLTPAPGEPHIITLRPLDPGIVFQRLYLR